MSDDEPKPPAPWQARLKDPRLRAVADLGAGALHLALAGLFVLILVDALVPPWHLPWRPLDLNHPVGAATAAKLRALEGEPERCLALLRDAGVRADPAPDSDDGGFCVVEEAVRYAGGPHGAVPGAPVARCPLVAATTVWKRQVVAPAAEELLGAPVERFEHYGTYACRRMYGRAEGRPSEHARANALDLAAFRLADGRRVTVAGHWDAPDERGVFLRRVRDGACGLFGAVLSPDYNRAHADHLHLDFGPWRACR